MSDFMTCHLSEWREFLYSGLSAAALFFSGTALVGYFIGSDAMVSWLSPATGHVPGMAFQTAAAIFALSVNQLFCRVRCKFIP